VELVRFVPEADCALRKNRRDCPALIERITHASVLLGSARARWYLFPGGTLSGNRSPNLSVLHKKAPFILVGAFLLPWWLCYLVRFCHLADIERAIRTEVALVQGPLFAKVRTSRVTEQMSTSLIGR